MTRVQCNVREYEDLTYNTLALPLGAYSLKRGKKALVTAIGPHKFALEFMKS